MLQRAWGRVAGVKVREESAGHCLMPELTARLEKLLLSGEAVSA